MEKKQKTEKTEVKAAKDVMSIEETKLGVTLVVDHNDLKAMGYSGKETCRVVIDDIRKKLELPSREERRQAKKELKAEAKKE